MIFNDHQVHQLHRMYTKPIGFVEWEEKLCRPSRYSSGGDESQKKWWPGTLTGQTFLNVHLMYTIVFQSNPEYAVEDQTNFYYG